jgi:hypothetical protein
VKNYTTKERNTAALILSVCASNNGDAGDTLDTKQAAEALGITGKRARALASNALMATPMDDKDTDQPIIWPEQCAEAESWVRSGWSDGDKFEPDPSDAMVAKLREAFDDDVESIEVTRTTEQLAVDDDTDDEDEDDEEHEYC